MSPTVLSISSQPGRLTLRSRTMPTWMVALLPAIVVAVLALLFFLGARVTGVAQLDCDRAAGRCTLSAGGETIDEIALSRVTGAERRARKGEWTVGLVLTTEGRDWVVVPAQGRGRTDADVAAIRLFLAGGSGERLTLRWDHRALLRAPLLLLLILFPISTVLLVRPTVCTVDRVARTVSMGWLRRRVHRLDAFRDVRVLTAAEEAEERIRRHVERTGRRPIFAPSANDLGRLTAHWIVFVGRDGSHLPATARLFPHEELGPAAEKLRSFLA
jgi:hypothetical protein